MGTGEEVLTAVGHLLGQTGQVAVGRRDRQPPRKGVDIVTLLPCGIRSRQWSPGTGWRHTALTEHRVRLEAHSTIVARAGAQDQC